jgi:hypothetical protein
LWLVWALAGWPAAPAWAGRRHVPPPLDLPAETAALCPTDAVDAARQTVAAARGDVEVERSLRTHDHAIATWAVCAHVLHAPSWTVPPVTDPLAQELIQAAAAAPGSRERIEGSASLRQAFPEAIAVLAMEDIASLKSVARAEPAMRLTLVAGRVGPRACPDYVRWYPRPDGSTTGVCTDQRTVEAMALDALTALAATTDPIESCPTRHWLCGATADWARDIWQAVSTIELPRFDDAPIAVPRGGRGVPLEPSIGWSMAITPSSVEYRRRDVVRFTPTGLHREENGTVFTDRPSDLEGDPVVFVRDDVTVAHLANELTRLKVPRPIFPARDDTTGELVELRLRWSPAGSPSLDAGPVLPLDVPVVGIVAEQLAKQADAAGTGKQIWLRVHPNTRFADLVAVHGAVVERHPNIFVSIIDLEKPDANRD